MTLHGYYESQEVSKHAFNFHALIMAAMRKADTHNLERLQTAFPEIWEELRARYNAPAGRLDGDPPV